MATRNHALSAQNGSSPSRGGIGQARVDVSPRSPDIRRRRDREPACRSSSGVAIAGARSGIGMIGQPYHASRSARIRLGPVIRPAHEHRIRVKVRQAAHPDGMGLPPRSGSISTRMARLSHELAGAWRGTDLERSSPICLFGRARAPRPTVDRRSRLRPITDLDNRPTAPTSCHRANCTLGRRVRKPIPDRPEGPSSSRSSHEKRRLVPDSRPRLGSVRLVNVGRDSSILTI